MVEGRDHLVAELQAEFADLPYSMAEEIIAERRAEADREGLELSAHLPSGYTPAPV